MSIELIVSEVGSALLGLLAGTAAIRIIWLLVNGNLCGIVAQYMIGIGG